MKRTGIAALFVLLCSVPASAKPNEFYPVTCDDLWAAVKDTLGNQHNYGIVFMSDDELKVSFVVVGDLTLFTDKVALSATDGGCAMKTKITDSGPDNTNWRQFHNRVGKSLARLQAAKAGPSSNSAGKS